MWQWHCQKHFDKLSCQYLITRPMFIRQLQSSRNIYFGNAICQFVTINSNHFVTINSICQSVFGNAIATNQFIVIYFGNAIATNQFVTFFPLYFGNAIATNQFATFFFPFISALQFFFFLEMICTQHFHNIFTKNPKW